MLPNSFYKAQKSCYPNQRYHEKEKVEGQTHSWDMIDSALWTS